MCSMGRDQVSDTFTIADPVKELDASRGLRVDELQVGEMEEVKEQAAGPGRPVAPLPFRGEVEAAKVRFARAERQPAVGPFRPPAQDGPGPQGPGRGELGHA
jgi:hypothetical protein